MICVVTDGAFKVLHKAVEALRKLSTEIYIECSETHLTLSSVNMAKNCYGKFTFDKVFFYEYEYTSMVTEGCELPPKMSCKIYSRCLARMFRRRTAKKVKTCKMFLQEGADNIYFRMRYKEGAMALHRYKLLEWDSLTVIYGIENITNRITGKGHAFHTLLNNFRRKDMQLYMEISQQRLHVRNFSLLQKGFKSIRTQVNVNPAEFQEYVINEYIALMIALKPIRSAVSFANHLKMNLTIHLPSDEEPVVITMKQKTYEVVYAASTFVIYSDDSSQSCNANEGRPGSLLTQEDQQVLNAVDWDDFGAADGRKTPDRAEIMFGRCNDPTFRLSQVDFGEVLAYNSDSEDNDL